MIEKMFKFKSHQSRLRRLNQAQINPVLAQVRKMLSSTDQRLILMVKG